MFVWACERLIFQHPTGSAHQSRQRSLFMQHAFDMERLLIRNHRVDPSRGPLALKQSPHHPRAYTQHVENYATTFFLFAVKGLNT